MFSSTSHNTSSSPTSANPHSPAYVLPANPFRRKSSDVTGRFSFSHSSTSSAAFWRRKSSTGSSATTNEVGSTPLTTPSTSPRGDKDTASYLSSAASTVTCSRCHAELAMTSQIISKGFTGRHGRAYLLSTAHESPNIIPTPNTRPYHYNHWTGNNEGGPQAENALPNTTLHRPVPRHLVTGMHTVCDVSCAQCGNVLGWKYVNAEEESQRYKVGKFILESKRTRVDAHWDGAGASWSRECRSGTTNSDEEDDFDYGLEGWTPSGRVKNCQTDSDDILFDSQDEDECEDLFAGIWSPALAKARRANKDF